MILYIEFTPANFSKVLCTHVTSFFGNQSFHDGGGAPVTEAHYCSPNVDRVLMVVFVIMSTRLSMTYGSFYPSKIK